MLTVRGLTCPGPGLVYFEIADGKYVVPSGLEGAGQTLPLRDLTYLNSAAGVVSLPGIMTRKILACVPPVKAMKHQIRIMFLPAGATGIRVLAAVFARRAASPATANPCSSTAWHQGRDRGKAELRLEWESSPASSIFFFKHPP